MGSIPTSCNQRRIDGTSNLPCLALGDKRAFTDWHLLSVPSGYEFHLEPSVDSDKKGCKIPFLPQLTLSRVNQDITMICRDRIFFLFSSLQTTVPRFSHQTNHRSVPSVTPSHHKMFLSPLETKTHLGMAENVGKPVRIL